MGKHLNDIVPEQRFGRLITQKYLGHCKWECQCDCGNATIVRADHLRSGCSRSCGCLRREDQSIRAKTHGQRKTRLYKIWQGMWFRCENPNAKCYQNYGGRGIRVCDEWHRFEPFFDWAMVNGYQENLTIDRINNDGDYEPSNCRWADTFIQSNNKRSTRYLTFNGQRKSVGEWSLITGFSRQLIYDRVFKHGWSVEQALTLPKSQGKRVKHGA